MADRNLLLDFVYDLTSCVNADDIADTINTLFLKTSLTLDFDDLDDLAGKLEDMGYEGLFPFESEDDDEEE